jgi:RND family efflux transporter MFP subunit
VDQVELRAQVAGTLTYIGFKDGDVVRKGALLFTIDPTPYQIKFDEGTAQIATARARLELAKTELARAQTLQKTVTGTIENVERRSMEYKSAQAALDEAEAQVRDAKFDLDRTHVYAPFSGRMGTHLVSVGNLVSGNRGGGSSTTLLATIVSIDPIYLNFDMSEGDYLNFQRDRTSQKSALANKVDIALSDEHQFVRHGTLNFLDNTIDRASGTIHARATVPNSDLLLTPGEFGRLRVNLQASHQVFCYVSKTHCRRTTSSGTRGEAGAGRVQLCNRSRPLTATRRMRIQQQIHCRRWSTQRLGLSRPASYRRQQPASQALAFAAKP